LRIWEPCWKLFELALEKIPSIGVGIVIFGIALQHQLKNIAAGIEVYFGSDIDIGDSILIKETHGVIIELHLTKIVALTEDGGRMIIPNQKLAEDVVIIYNKKEGCRKLISMCYLILNSIVV